MADTSISPEAVETTAVYKPRSKLAIALQRSETLRGYLLMTPTLLILTFGIIVPFIILLVLSTWTRQGFGFDMTPVLTNYERIWNEPIFMSFLSRRMEAPLPGDGELRP